MTNESEKNDKRTEPVASTSTKRPWHAPEIEEVDFAETQSGVSGAGGDNGGYS
jgi:hypothetical protein